MRALKNGDTQAIETLYDQCFEIIEIWVKRNSGTSVDAEDLFQDCLESLFVRLRSEKGLVLSSNLSTYVQSMARNQWYKRLRRKGKMTVVDTHDKMEGEVELLEEMDKRERLKLYQEKFQLLGEDCQRILTLFYNGIKMDEIAQKMGFASAGYAKKRKHKCKEKLVALITADERFNELKQ